MLVVMVVLVMLVVEVLLLGDLDLETALLMDGMAASRRWWWLKVTPVKLMWLRERPSVVNDMDS